MSTPKLKEVTMLNRLEDALAYAENGDFEGAAMWARIAAEEWTTHVPDPAPSRPIKPRKG